jgi:DNA-directed RNA polymerase subunit RPC12/RpoP
MSNNMDLKQEARVELIKALSPPLECTECGKKRYNRNRCEHCGSETLLEGKSE